MRGGGSGIACPGFSVRFFRLGVSKQNDVGFHRLRDALKRHPCRIGLNRASMHGFPKIFTFR